MSLSDLKNEYKEVERSIEKVNKEIAILQCKRQELQERRQELEVEIDVCQSSELSSKTSKRKWATNEFPWQENLRKSLCEVFGMANFRNKQLEVMNATMSKEDVFLVMPTGGGKSLCYQLPAVLSSGITLVVSPLVSLMTDQCHNIEQYGIGAEFLSADTPKEKVSEITKKLSTDNPGFKLLYVTPEKIAKSKRFMAQLEKCYKASNLSRIAIDEAHCASQWGNDFRPDYKTLGILKRQYPSTPILALTATATSKVITDTKKILNIPHALIFKTGLNRPLLYYEVRLKPKDHNDVIDDMAQTITKNFPGQSGIVYCFSRADAEKVSKDLNRRGLKAACYHAYLPGEVRKEVHCKWRDNTVQVICATVAFGMGIDKPDVRFVIHHSISKSVENYYQESGRAGRDGRPALCLLYFGFQDMFRQSTMVLNEQTGLENLSQMIGYCFDTTSCRRQKLASHFGESPQSMTCAKSCDVCLNSHKSVKCDVTKPSRALLAVVTRAEKKGEGHRLTALKLLEAAAGRGPEKTADVELRLFDTSRVQRIVTYMLLRGYLREDFHFTPYSTISYLVPGKPFNQIYVEFPAANDQPISSYHKIFSNMIGQQASASSEYAEARNKKRKIKANIDCKGKRCRNDPGIVVIDD